MEDTFKKAELISKHLKGNLTSAERKELSRWLELDAGNKKLLKDLEDRNAIEVELDFFLSVDKKAAWENLSARMDSRK